MATIKFRDQHYRTLHSKLTTMSRKFEDPEFSPQGISSWLRPPAFTLTPRLVSDGVSGSDVQAGDSGDSDWFVTACSVLTIRPSLIALVVPGYQSQDYGFNFHPGIFRFAFGRQGRVYEVVVDDRLPARGGRPRRCRSADGNEFWGALLEKAYAKLHGGYQTLRHGRVADAIASFARGIPDHWDLRLLSGQVDLGDAAVQERLARLMECHVRRDGLLLFSIQSDSKGDRIGDSTPENLVYGRGYLLTDVQEVRLEDGSKVWLLKLRTARYSEVTREWFGPWRDGGPEWKQLDAESGARVNHWFKDDCIFWMCLTDAMTRFTDLDMCVARDDCGFNGGHWRCASACLEGRWSLAGDGDFRQEDPLTGPQFLLQVKGDGFQTVTLCLEQGGPQVACRPDLQAEIGLDLYRAEDNRRCRLRFPARLVARAAPERRAVVTFGAALSPGTYVLVPTTLGPADDFTLRAFSRLGFKLKPLTRVGRRGGSSCASRRRVAVSRLAVQSVTGLAQWLGREAGEVKAKLRVSCSDSDIADWYTRYYYADRSKPDTYSTDLSLLIQRQRLEAPVHIEVFHSSVGSYTKSPVGWANIGESSAPTGHEVTLFGWDGQPMGVKLHCSLCTLDDEDEF